MKRLVEYFQVIVRNWTVAFNRLFYNGLQKFHNPRFVLVGRCIIPIERHTDGEFVVFLRTKVFHIVIAKTLGNKHVVVNKQKIHLLLLHREIRQRGNLAPEHFADEAPDTKAFNANIFVSL